MSASTGPPASHADHADALGRLFELAHEGIYIGTVAVGPNRGITYAANPSLKAIFSYARSTPTSEVLPFTADHFVEPSARAGLLQCLFASGAVTNYRVRMRRQDRSEISVEITARARSVDDARCVEVEALVRAVDPQVALPERSAVVDRELWHADRMASLGQAISVVAHELNNPLATIINWSERLADGPAGDPKRGLELIRGEAHRAARIVRNILTFARKQPSTRAMVDVNGIVQETLGLRSHERHHSHVGVTFELASSLPLVFANAHQIQQVLLNLVINAEQAMMAANGHGALALRTSHDAAAGKVVIEVSDNGPGVALDVMAQIFDPFFTTKAAGQGTGLGLTVARAIVREHGGDIRLQSNRVGGASFLVTLPVRVPPAAGKPLVTARLPPRRSPDG